MDQLLRFFVWTFAVSWSCFIASAWLSHSSPEQDAFWLVQLIALVGVVTPSIVALVVMKRHCEPGKVSRVLAGLGKWRVNPLYYLFAGGMMIVVKLLVSLMHKISTGVWPIFGKTDWYVMLSSVALTFWIQAGEEIGWRGFALPRMSARWGLPLSTIALGLIWSFWHLPLFFVRGADTFGQSFPLYIIQVTAISVITGWLFWRTGGSLLLTMIIHSAINNTKDIVPSAIPGSTNPFLLSHSLVAWMTVFFLWILAGWCLRSMRSVKGISMA